MSQVTNRTIACPNCGHEQNFIIWDSLNGILDPEAKDSLINGTLFRFKCDECGYETEVVYDILYHDMEHHTMVYRVQPESVEQAGQYMLIASEKTKSLDANLPKTRNRIVTDNNRLREKAIIFGAGLDDRIVEIVKLICWMEAVKTITDAKEEDMYFNITNDSNWIVEIVGKDVSCNVPKEMYDQISSQFSPIFDQIGDDELIVDHNFAGTVCLAFNDAHKNNKKPWQN